MKKINLFRAFLLALAILIIAYFIPISYILKAPGSAQNTGELIHIANHPAGKGNFYLTTVIHEKANLLFALYPLFNREASLVPKEESQWLEFSNYEKYMSDQMEESKYLAKVAALRFLGYHVPMNYYGLKVLGILPQSKVGNFLQTDDIILKAENQEVNSAPALAGILKKFKAGDIIKVSLARKNKILKGKLTLISMENRTMLGIQVQSLFRHDPLPLKITINSRFINGSSAGLIFALEIINRLTPQGLIQRDIAGTGTIDAEGRVGAIEGVKYKIMAARAKGLKYFILPQENLEEAGKWAYGMKLLPVQTLKEAVEKVKRVDK
jgi:Lon-like protease